MSHRLLSRALLFASLAAPALLPSAIATAQDPPHSHTAVPEDLKMDNHAKGLFDVKLTAQTDEGGDAKIGRMLLDKQFHGDLQATSKGQMVSTMGQVKGSAGYVAMERVVGSLHGRKGSFVLQHSGTMNRGAPHLIVTVVPDSGTDELTGLVGSMNIIVAEGKHSYEFVYALE